MNLSANKNDSSERRVTTKITTTFRRIATPTTTAATKTFRNFSELNRWVNNSLNQKLYKIGRIDWVKNTVKVEGRPIVTSVITL